MEFDVRLCAAADPASKDDDAGRPPYIVEVVHTDWPDLAEVLDQIIDEQQEFDLRLATGAAQRDGRRVMVVIILAGAADILLLLGLLEL